MSDKDKEQKELIAKFARPVGCATQSCRLCATCEEKEMAMRMAFKALESL